MKRGKLFYVTRSFVRLGLGRWTVEVNPPQAPAVYVCSHKNTRGPLAIEAWLPFAVRPWVLHVFLDRESCRKQYSEYTFSRRFGLPKPLSELMAWILSGYISGLMSSIGAIPVYRGTVKASKTLKESVAALQAGNSIVIFPDVDYTSKTEGIGDIYDGFLLLERFWRKASNQPLSFIPLRLDTETHRITEGRAVTFNRNAEWKTEIVRVREALRSNINEK